MAKPLVEEKQDHGNYVWISNKRRYPEAATLPSAPYWFSIASCQNRFTYGFSSKFDTGKAGVYTCSLHENTIFIVSLQNQYE